jgi:hypothetical protein
MCALLAVEPKGKAHIFKVELDGNTARELKLYCRFTNDAKENSVIKAALNHVFRTDDEFTKWKEDPANARLPEPRSRRKANTNAAAAAATDHKGR